jgi:hypothetical protein
MEAYSNDHAITGIGARPIQESNFSKPRNAFTGRELHGMTHDKTKDIPLEAILPVV